MNKEYIEVGKPFHLRNMTTNKLKNIGATIKQILDERYFKEQEKISRKRKEGEN